jgi:hypothetical protein
MDLSQVTWRKSSRSQGTTDNCVEIAELGGGIAVRDSKDPAGPTLHLARETWRNITARIKHGLHDLT